MKDGNEIISEVAFAKGAPAFSPLSTREIEEKFMKNVAYSKAITEKNAEKILNLIKNIEEVDKISDLAKLLVTN